MSRDFLPASQAFVYREVTGHRRYQVEAFAQRRQNPERFPFEPLHTLLPARGPLGLAEYLLFLVTCHSPTFVKRFEESRFDLIHAQFGPAAVYALPLANRFDLPLVCTFGGIDVAALEPGMRGRPDYLLYRRHAHAMLRRVDRFLAVSKDLAARLVRLGAPAERVHLFHRGVDLPRDPTGRPPVGAQGPLVLMVGRFVEKKGFEDGLQAATMLRREGLALRVRLVGDGPLRPVLVHRAREGGLLDERTFPGALPHKEVFEQMGQAHVLLVPSVTAANGDTEGISNVLKEACARALPVVITRHGGLPEAVEEGVTGFVVPEHSPRALAERLRELVTDAALRERMGQAGRAKMAAEFSIESRMEALEMHYDAVLGARGGRRG